MHMQNFEIYLDTPLLNITRVEVCVFQILLANKSS